MPNPNEIPPPAIDTSALSNLVQQRGSDTQPVKNISRRKLKDRHQRSLLPLSRQKPKGEGALYPQLLRFLGNFKAPSFNTAASPLFGQSSACLTNLHPRPLLLTLKFIPTRSPLLSARNPAQPPAASNSRRQYCFAVVYQFVDRRLFIPTTSASPMCFFRFPPCENGNDDSGKRQLSL